jgi:hypothetical protein
MPPAYGDMTPVSSQASESTHAAVDRAEVTRLWIARASRISGNGNRAGSADLGVVVRQRARACGGAPSTNSSKIMRAIESGLRPTVGLHICRIAPSGAIYRTDTLPKTNL